MLKPTPESTRYNLASASTILPAGTPVGAAEDALDCACMLYLNDPLPLMLDTPTN